MDSTNLWRLAGGIAAIVLIPSLGDFELDFGISSGVIELGDQSLLPGGIFLLACASTAASLIGYKHIVIWSLGIVSISYLVGVYVLWQVSSPAIPESTYLQTLSKTYFSLIAALVAVVAGNVMAKAIQDKWSTRGDA